MTFRCVGVANIAVGEDSCCQVKTRPQPKYFRFEVNCLAARRFNGRLEALYPALRGALRPRQHREGQTLPFAIRIGCVQAGSRKFRTGKQPEFPFWVAIQTDIHKASAPWHDSIPMFKSKTLFAAAQRASLTAAKTSKRWSCRFARAALSARHAEGAHLPGLSTTIKAQRNSS
jgi:hypothetical protein